MQQLAHALLEVQPVIVQQVMYFLARSCFVPVYMHNFTACVMLWRLMGWMFIILQLTNFVLFNILLQLCVSIRDCSLTISTSWSGYYYGCYTQSLRLYFQGSGLPLSFSETWWAMWGAHIALQGVQLAVLMLHRMAFSLFGKVIAWHLDNSMVLSCYAMKDIEDKLWMPMKCPLWTHASSKPLTTSPSWPSSGWNY